MTIPISVVVPVGPKRHHSEFLIECLESVNAQTQPPDEVVIVDSSGIMIAGELDCPCASNVANRPIITVPATGIASGFNTGLAHARNELIFFLGSDDLLKPRCLELCYAAWHFYKQALGWYFCGVEYSNGFTQNTPCLAAMVSKELWRVAGPLKNDGEHHYAGCEIEYISRMLNANGDFGATYRVSDEPLYWFRMREELVGNVGIAK